MNPENAYSVLHSNMGPESLNSDPESSPRCEARPEVCGSELGLFFQVWDVRRGAGPAGLSRALLARQKG